jgi:hypothetical protein
VTIRATTLATVRWGILSVLSLVARPAAADELRGIVFDQTSSPLPGVTVQLLDGVSVVASTTTSGDGSFALQSPGPGVRVRASLKGFETLTVPVADAARIVLPLARATETTDVTATTVGADSPTAAATGTQLSRATMQRLPTAKQHARDALPLLPSVIRGPDGLLRIDGVRPHESPLLLDGFNVTDPATGLSSIDLPIESVRNVAVLRDPMTVTFGGALGSLASIETREGSEAFEGGIQGFVPRPRLTGGGFGRLEGFSPRAYMAGPAGGSARYFVAAEFDFDRIPVPGVTTGTGGPDTRQTGGSMFGRADLQLSSEHTVSVEGLFLPESKTLHGLGPLRTEAAAPTLFDRDAFGGLVDRHVLGTSGVLTLRLGLLSHRAEVRPNGDGQAEIAPSGWSGGSFSSMERTATRVEGSISWQKALESANGLHDLTVQAIFERRRLRGAVSERPVSVRDESGALVRSLTFGPGASIEARDQAAALAVRDLWHATETLEIDAGVRGDWSSLGGWAPSARAGLRYAPHADGTTVLKAGVGTFVGSVPLSVPAFAGFPVRSDGDGTTSEGILLRPLVSRLALPRAFATNARLEQRLGAGWDGLLGVSFRQASRLATLDVGVDAGSLAVRSIGRSTYREAEAGIRRSWGKDNMLFVSYTRSSARGEVNDFSSLFANGDVEILQRGGVVRLGADAPNRVLAWGSFVLPAGFGLSPATEWHSGFPYAVVDARRQYVGPPNAANFPAFLSIDLVVYKSLTIKGKAMKLNVQLFNLTNHFNPRDVFAVVGAPRFGTFANSVGPTVRGDIAVNW